MIEQNLSTTKRNQCSIEKINIEVTICQNHKKIMLLRIPIIRSHTKSIFKTVELGSLNFIYQNDQIKHRYNRMISY